MSTHSFGWSKNDQKKNEIKRNEKQSKYILIEIPVKLKRLQ